MGEMDFEEKAGVKIVGKLRRSQSNLRMYFVNQPCSRFT